MVELPRSRATDLDSLIPFALGPDRAHTRHRVDTATKCVHARLRRLGSSFAERHQNSDDSHHRTWDHPIEQVRHGTYNSPTRLI